MHKNPDLRWIITLVAISIVLLYSLTTRGIYTSHDSEVHIARIAQVTEGLKHQNPPIRWLSNFNFGFGYPTFVFAYSLPYYLASIINTAIKNPEITFKLLMFLSLSLSAITFYYFARINFSRLAAFIGSIFYVSAPYRFADIYERGALGEALSFMVSPFLLMSPHIFKINVFTGVIVTAIVAATFISIHAITFIIFLTITLAYCILIFQKSLKLYVYFGAGLLLGFLISAYQWMPMIFEQKYTQIDKTYYTIFEMTFININQLLRIPREGVNIGTGIQLGLAQSAIILISLSLVIFDIIQKKSLNRFKLFFLITSLGAVFLTLDISKQIWMDVKPLQTILFPWRFLTITTFATAILASLLVQRVVRLKYGAIIIALMIFIAIYPSRHYLKGTGWHTLSNIYYQNYNDPQKLDNYYLPRGLTKNLAKLKLPPISLIEGDGSVELIQRQNHKLEAKANLTEQSLIQFHTIYFPGWQLYIDGQKSEIVKDFPNLEGLIVAKVNEGKHDVNLKFEETPLRRFANMITLACFLVLALTLIFKKRHAT